VFKELLAKLAAALKDAKIPYMVIGGQAVLIHGEPRLTKDIDITVGVNVSEFEKVNKIAVSVGLTILPESPESFVAETMVLPCLDPETGIRVDMTFSFSDYEKEAIEQAIQIKLGNTSVSFINAENLIIHKIIASRPRDLEDVRAIILKNPDLDKDYIKSKLSIFSESLDTDYTAVFTEILQKLK
jgi:predicted nucleotidyltransferase